MERSIYAGYGEGGSGTLPSMEPAIAVSKAGEWDSDDDNEDDEIYDFSEPVDWYDLRIYYPLSIGEVLDKRYKIVHKLGWGGGSILRVPGSSIAIFHTINVTSFGSRGAY